MLDHYCAGCDSNPCFALKLALKLLTCREKRETEAPPLVAPCNLFPLFSHNTFNPLPFPQLQLLCFIFQGLQPQRESSDEDISLSKTLKEPPDFRRWLPIGKLLAPQGMLLFQATVKHRPVSMEQMTPGCGVLSFLFLHLSPSFFWFPSPATCTVPGSNHQPRFLEKILSTDVWRGGP